MITDPATPIYLPDYATPRRPATSDEAWDDAMYGLIAWARDPGKTKLSHVAELLEVWKDVCVKEALDGRTG